MPLKSVAPVESRRGRRSAGFTLMEVLVALVVVALALGALIKAAGGQGRNAAYLRDRTVAHWVAMNALAEIQLEESWPDIGELDGEMEMLDRLWQWRAEIEETEDGRVRRVTIQARLADENGGDIGHLVGFVSDPSADAGNSSDDEGDS